MSAKKVIRIVLIVVVSVIAIVGLLFAGLMFHIGSTKEYCSNNAEQKAELSDYPDRQYPASRDQCMRDKGLGGF